MNLTNDFVTFSISILKKKKKKENYPFYSKYTIGEIINNEINYGKNFDCKIIFLDRRVKLILITLPCNYFLFIEILRIFLYIIDEIDRNRNNNFTIKLYLSILK